MGYSLQATLNYDREQDLLALVCRSKKDTFVLSEWESWGLTEDEWINLESIYQVDSGSRLAEYHIPGYSLETLKIILREKRKDYFMKYDSYKAERGNKAIKNYTYNIVQLDSAHHQYITYRNAIYYLAFPALSF